MKRRDFVKKSAITVSAITVVPSLSTQAQVTKQNLKPIVAEIDLLANPSAVSLLPGETTNLFCFDANLIGGSTQVLKNKLGFLGPIIEVKKEDRIKINFKNNLPEMSVVHWHGLHLPEDQDGHPRFAIKTGETYSYDLDIKNRAGLYWYHPHPHGRTGYQVYQGLAGLLVVRDSEEESLQLPKEENEVFLVFQDRQFDEKNQLVYVESGHDQLMGKIGDTLLVNGGFEFIKEVKAEAYRLRILNGSNALSYRLKWDDQRPLTIIGNDGGLFDGPVERESLLLSPGERLDIILNLENSNINDVVKLLSVPIVDNPEAQALTLYEFQVQSMGVKKFKLPQVLSRFEEIKRSEAVNKDNIKSFQLLPQPGMGWTIDGLEYEMGVTRPKETIKLGTTEIWEFDLTSFGMIHPMHIHGSQFQVIERIHGPYSKGLVLDKGWKDTVSVLPGDKVRLIKRFNDYAGLFLFHCHILEHEDRTMMRDFLVE